MKHQRGKVSKPRVEQADKEVKSWSPSQANSDFVVSFLDDVPLSFIQTEPFSFLHARREKRKRKCVYPINHTRNKYAQTKTKKHEHEHQSKKERRDAITVFYQITSSIKHQQER